MKVIIIEGPDNCGKDTLIGKILEQFPTVTMIHCSKPFSKKHSSKEQDLLFNSYVDEIVNQTYNTHILLFNRGFHGEYVYGTIYRKRNLIEVENMIRNCELKLKNSNYEIYYIQLINESIETLSKNEDGLSLSSGNIDLIKKESELFKEIFNKSILNKKLIYVNNSEKTGFRSKESIFNDVMKFINN
jgi:thymidylate kinase